MDKKDEYEDFYKNNDRDSNMTSLWGSKKEKEMLCLYTLYPFSRQ